MEDETLDEVVACGACGIEIAGAEGIVETVPQDGESAAYDRTVHPACAVFVEVAAVNE